MSWIFIGNDTSCLVLIKLVAVSLMNYSSLSMMDFDASVGAKTRLDQESALDTIFSIFIAEFALDLGVTYQVKHETSQMLPWFGCKSITYNKLRYSSSSWVVTA